MIYAIRYLRKEKDCFGVPAMSCFKVSKLFTEAVVENGRTYYGDDFAVDISCGFSTEEAANMHIRYPICYPDDKSATEILQAPFDRAGWKCFWNPVDGINDPDNATLLKYPQ